MQQLNGYAHVSRSRRVVCIPVCPRTIVREALNLTPVGVTRVESGIQVRSNKPDPRLEEGSKHEQYEQQSQMSCRKLFYFSQPELNE